VRQLADAGDENAVILAAWTLGKTGQWQEGLPYAKRAVDLGASWVAANYVGNMIGTPEHREAALAMLERALANGWSVDPLGWVGAVAQQGDAAGVKRILDLALQTWPETRQHELNHQLLDAFRGASHQLDSQIGQVEQSKTVAVEAIQGHEAAVEQERQRVAAVAKKALALAHGVASEELARQYADKAKWTQIAGWIFTGLAVLVGAGAAALAAVITLEYANDQDPDILLGLAKSAIALPIALLAAYLGRLAGRYRDMAWRLRHMELQLLTAELYIAELPEDRRAALVEQLALRFFPGQPLDITTGGGGNEGPGLAAVGTPSSPVSF
jgi:hypothetical protein